MLLGDMIKRIKDRSGQGDPNNVADFITQQMLRAINDARRDVVKLLPQEAFHVDASSAVATVQGTTTYNFNGNSNDVEKLVVLHYTSNSHEYIIKKIESIREWYMNIYIANASQNRPYAYVQRGLDATTKCPHIELYPTPDAVYSINYTYYKDPTKTDLTLSNINTEFPDMPSYVQDVIWKGALSYFLENTKDSRYEIAKNEYEQSKLALNTIENDTSDTDLQFRFDTGKISFVDPATGIRLQ